MSRGVSNKITYKPYSQNEQWLLPPSLDELVPENHFARIVSKTVDELRIEEVFAKGTKGGGASRYNPVMLLKVLIYCYMTGTYPSRMIAKQCRENVNVMWLTGFQKPDFKNKKNTKNGLPLFEVLITSRTAPSLMQLLFSELV